MRIDFLKGEDLDLGCMLDVVARFEGTDKQRCPEAMLFAGDEGKT